jgi:two-component system cell cycle response regulator
MSARVLVVDDVPVNRRLLEAKLAAEFFEVAMAASGAEALSVAARWSPDVVLLDVMMPEMDGFETCRALKADPATAHVPVVMVTALIDRRSAYGDWRPAPTTSCPSRWTTRRCSRGCGPFCG